MYRADDLITGWSGLIGWRQFYDTSDGAIASSLTSSESGMFYQDTHPLMRLEGIRDAAAPMFTDKTYPAWAAGTAYLKGQVVTVSTAGKNYRALVDNTGVDPTSDSSTWEVFDAFSNWLEQKTRASMLSAASNLLNGKIAEGAGKSLLDSTPLFSGAGRIKDTQLNQGNLVGLEITPVRAPGVTTKVDKIGLQFTGQGTVTVYVMHSSRVDPVKILDFNRVRAGGMEWFEPAEPLYLPHVSADNDAGGSWYLVYAQSQLPADSLAVVKDKDWSQRPCVGCDINERMAYDQYSKYLEIHPFKVSEESMLIGDYSGDFNHDFNTEGIKLWDIADNLYTYTNNYGMNLQLSIVCDVTELLIQQRRSFVDIIRLQTAADILRELAYNPAIRLNRASENVSVSQIIYELDGDSQGKKAGIKYELSKAVEAASVDLTGMSRVCFSCGRKGVRFGTV